MPAPVGFFMPMFESITLCRSVGLKFRTRNWLESKARAVAGASWAHMCQRVESIRPRRMRDLREEAAALRLDLDRFILLSGRRMAASRTELAALPLPGGTDWRWRPEFLCARITPTGISAPQSGAELIGETRLWHDSDHPAIVARQIQNARATDLAQFGLRLETLGFTGSFLSLSIALPAAALAGLTRDYILRFETTIEAERPLEAYARLNIGNGPNTEEMLRHFGEIRSDEDNVHVAEYDLVLTEMNEKRLDRIWLDLIFEKPVMNAVVVREMIFSRHLRANV